jgi:DNA-binding NtrC family response regulator
VSLATILLVDDNLDFAKTMTKRLSQRHINVINAQSVSDALAFLSAHDRIDVIILDDKLPGMHAFDTLTQIRRRFPLIEVILFTGHASIESAIEGLNLGAFEYMMKLCDTDYLVDKILEAAALKRKHEDKIFQAKLKEFFPSAVWSETAAMDPTINI